MTGFALPRYAVRVPGDVLVSDTGGDEGEVRVWSASFVGESAFTIDWPPGAALGARSGLGLFGIPWTVRGE